MSDSKEVKWCKGREREYKVAHQLYGRFKRFCDNVGIEIGFTFYAFLDWYEEHRIDGYEVHIKNIDTHRLTLDDLIVTDIKTRFQTKRKKSYTSKYVGVHYDKSRGKWVGSLEIDNKLVRKVKRFRSEREALEYRNRMIDEFLVPAPKQEWCGSSVDDMLESIAQK